MLPIPIPDADERQSMRSESRSDRGGNGAETPDIATTSEALERQLMRALDAADTERTRFHLRQALQLVQALDE